MSATLLVVSEEDTVSATLLVVSEEDTMSATLLVVVTKCQAEAVEGRKGLFFWLMD